MSHSDDVYLRLDGDVEMRLDAIDDVVTEGYKLQRRCSAIVDQYEGLFVIDATVADALALPSAMFDEPSGRHFYVIGIYIVLGCPRATLIVLVDGNYRILEERSCIAYLGRIRQLTITNIYDYIPHLPWRG